MSYIHIMLNIIPTLYEGYIVSVHRMVMENRPVDSGSIQASQQPISMRIKHRTRANDTLCKIEYYRNNNHIVRLLIVHKKHIIRTCLIYHAAFKVEFQPFKRSYSQLTFFNSKFFKLKNVSCEYDCLNVF